MKPQLCLASFCCPHTLTSFFLKHPLNKSHAGSVSSQGLLLGNLPYDTTSHSSYTFFSSGPRDYIPLNKYPLPKIFISLPCGSLSHEYKHGKRKWHRSKLSTLSANFYAIIHPTWWCLCSFPSYMWSFSNKEVTLHVMATLSIPFIAKKKKVRNSELGFLPFKKIFWPMHLLSGSSIH